MLKLNEKLLKEIAIKAEKKGFYYDVVVDIVYIIDHFEEENRVEITLLADGEEIIEDVLFEGKSPGKAYNMAKQTEAFLKNLLENAENVEVTYRKSVWA